MVRIIGKDGANWELFDPAEFQGEYEPRVQLDITVQQKKAEQAAQAREMLGAFLGDMDINQQELKKMVLQRTFDLDPDEVSLLVQPNPMQGMIDPMTGQPLDPAMSGVVPTPSPDMMVPEEDMMLPPMQPQAEMLL